MWQSQKTWANKVNGVMMEKRIMLQTLYVTYNLDKWFVNLAIKSVIEPTIYGRL